MTIKQSIEGASVDVRGAASLPDATAGIAAAYEADKTKDELPETKSRTMTEKGKPFRLSTLKERRKKINAVYRKKAAQLRICSSAQETW